MENRVPTKPGRIKLTDDSGNVKYYYMERADEPTTEGTPLNKNTLFNSKNTERYGSQLPSEAFELLGKKWGEFVLPANAWSSTPDSNGYYTLNLNVAGMKEQFFPSIIPLYTTTEQIDDKKAAFGQIDQVTTEADKIIFYAAVVPDLDLNIVVEGV